MRDKWMDAYDDTVHGHALGAGGGLETLDRVKCLERGVRERVDDVEEEVCRDGALTDTQRLVAFRHLCPLRGEPAVDREENRAGERAPDEHLAPRHPVGECDAHERAYARRDRVAEVQHELHIVVVPDCAVDLRVEVPEAVPGELTKDTLEFEAVRIPLKT